MTACTEPPSIRAASLSRRGPPGIRLLFWKVSHFLLMMNNIHLLILVVYQDFAQITGASIQIGIKFLF